MRRFHELHGRPDRTGRLLACCCVMYRAASRRIHPVTCRGVFVIDSGDGGRLPQENRV